MRKRLLLRPALWALVILAVTTAWHLRPLDRSTLYPVPFANGKYGYVNADGRVVVGAEWDVAYSFGADGYALVRRGSRDEGKLGFIDRVGKLAEPLDEVFRVHFQFNNFIGIETRGRKSAGTAGEVTNTGQVVVIHDERFTPLRQGKPTKWGLARNGKTILKPKWDDIHPFGACDLAPVKIGKKWGFLNRFGTVAIEPKWDYVCAFAKNGLAVVMIGEVVHYHSGRPSFMTHNEDPSKIPSGFIDRNGKVVIPLEWDGAWSFDDSGLAIVQKHNKFGAIDSKGKLVVPTEWDAIELFDPLGLARVKKSSYHGFIDRTGATIIPLVWDEIQDFDDFEWVRADDIDVIDNSATKKNHLSNYRTVIRQGRKGLAHVTRNRKHGCIDRTGNVVIPLEWDYLSHFDASGLALVGNNGKCGFIDRDGMVVTPLVWDDATIFDEQGTAQVEKSKKHGTINRAGKIVVPLEWDRKVRFDEEGLAIVTKSKKCGVINREGKLVIPLDWEEISEFRNGIARATKDKKHGFINRRGETLVAPDWDNAVAYRYTFEVAFEPRDIPPRPDPYTPDLIEVTRDKKLGIIDWSGNVIIAPEWTRIDIRSDAEAKSAAFVVTRPIDDNANAGWFKTGRDWLFKLFRKDEPNNQLCHLYDTQGRLIWSNDWLSETTRICVVALVAGIVVAADCVVLWRRRRAKKN